MRRLLGVLMMLSSVTAHAGGFVIGGGEYVRDGRNPWWLQNTTDVTYCIAQDPATFHADRSIVERRVVEAIAYWKDEFSRSFSPNFAAGRVLIATQQFHRVTCDQSGVDLRFQLGTLTPEQRLGLGDVRRFIGVAARTDYDIESLRGRGFIYIAADEGPDSATGSGLVVRPWQLGNGGLLYRVLVHELGHVFGLPDSSALPVSDRGTGMMSAVYPEHILQDLWAQNLANSTELPDYFEIHRPRMIDGSCTGSGGQQRQGYVYGFPEHWLCYQIWFDPASNLMTVYAKAGYEGDDDLASYTRIGQAALTAGMMLQWEPAVSVWLPPGQKVFPNAQPEDRLIMGPMVTFHTRRGVYRSFDGTTVRDLVVSLPLNGRWTQIGGVIDGNLVTNVGGELHNQDNPRR